MASVAKKRKISHVRSKESDFNTRQHSGVRTVVPWSSFDEWLELRLKILENSEESTAQALSRLRIWQLRCDSKKCPAFVEATIHLLRAFVADKDNADTSEVLSVYGEAINKFVQTVLERSNKTGEMTQNKNIAGSLRIPQWIVDVRNDAIHHFRGSLPLYRTTANTVFEWLKQNYWAQNTTETVADKGTAVIAAEGSLQEYIQLALCAKTATERSLADAALANLKSSIASSNIESLVTHLVDLEALTSIDKSRSTNDIPASYKNAYLPVFEILGEHLTTLFTTVLKSLSLPAVVCSNRNVDRSMQILSQWIAWLVSGSAICHGKDLASNLNLKRILQAAVTVVSTPTIDLLELCLDKMDPPLSEEKADFVRKLYVAFSGERAKTCDRANGFDKMTVGTVEHVVAERAKRDKLNRQQLQSSPRVDWSGVPLGLLPDTVAVGNLHLDVNLEGDYVPLDVETEDDAVIKHEKKFQEEQSQTLEMKCCNEKRYETQRQTLSSGNFKLWRIPNSQMMMIEDEERDSSYGDYVEQQQV